MNDFNGERWANGARVAWPLAFAAVTGLCGADP